MNLRLIILCVISIILLFHLKNYIKISNTNEVLQINNFNKNNYDNFLREKKPIIVNNIFNNTNAFNNLKIKNIDENTKLDIYKDANQLMKSNIKNYKNNFTLALLNDNLNIVNTGYNNLLPPLSVKTYKQIIYGKEGNKTMIITVKSEHEIFICSDGECIISLFKPIQTNFLKTNNNFTKNFNNSYINSNIKIKTLNISLNTGDCIIIPSGWSYYLLFKKPTLLYNIKNDDIFFLSFSWIRRLIF